MYLSAFFMDISVKRNLKMSFVQIAEIFSPLTPPIRHNRRKSPQRAVAVLVHGDASVGGSDARFHGGEHYASKTGVTQQLR